MLFKASRPPTDKKIPHNKFFKKFPPKYSFGSLGVLIICFLVELSVYSPKSMKNLSQLEVQENQNGNNL